MVSPSCRSFKGMLGLGILLAMPSSASASPLPRDAAAGETSVERRLSVSDLAQTDSSELLSAVTSGGIQGQIGASRSSVRDLQSFDFGQQTDPATGRFGGSLQDSLRSFITIRRSSGPAQNDAPRAGRNRPAPDDGLAFDLGYSTNEWVRESVQGVVTSVLALNVNERGQVSFSVLGMGDFSVIVSGDRSEVAFASGGEIVASAQRTVYGREGAGSSYGYWGNGAGSGSTESDAGESPIQRALALALDVATHPLTFIVYALIAGYGLIWAIVSSRAKRPLHKRGHRHSSDRLEPAAYARAAGVATATAPAKKVRKRMRMRMRVRKYR